MKLLSRLVVAALFTLAFASGSDAQTATATLRGRVHDPQGAPVPAAVVTITAADTAQTRRVVTGADGSFVAANLAPGMVNVDVAAPGFRDVKKEGVALEVGQAASVVVELTLDSVRVNVNVEGGIGVIAVDTSRSVVDAVIRSALIDVLPLNGRNFLELALLVPGNTPAPNFDPTKSNSVVISSAGQLGRGGNIMIDGSDNNDDVVGGPLLNVTEESVQEFQIATNRFSAETGRSAGSAINVVTKSGTDRLRGSASLFARDQRWQSLPATYDESPASSRRSTGSRWPGRPVVRWRPERSGSGLSNTGTRMAERWLARETSRSGSSGARLRPLPSTTCLDRHGSTGARRGRTR